MASLVSMSTSVSRIMEIARIFASILSDQRCALAKRAIHSMRINTRAWISTSVRILTIVITFASMLMAPMSAIAATATNSLMINSTATILMNAMNGMSPASVAFVATQMAHLYASVWRRDMNWTRTEEHASILMSVIIKSMNVVIIAQTTLAGESDNINIIEFSCKCLSISLSFFFLPAFMEKILSFYSNKKMYTTQLQLFMSRRHGTERGYFKMPRYR